MRVFVDEGPVCSNCLFQVVDVERDDGVVAGDVGGSLPVVGLEGPEGKLLDVVGFLHLSCATRSAISMINLACLSFLMSAMSRKVVSTDGAETTVGGHFECFPFDLY